MSGVSLETLKGRLSRPFPYMVDKDFDNLKELE